MSDEVENRATIEAFWLAWNEERLDYAIELRPGRSSSSLTLAPST
jgi:hypothetical protein